MRIICSAIAALLSAKANAFYSPSSLLSRRVSLFATTSATSDNMSTEVAKVSVKISELNCLLPFTILSNTSTNVVLSIYNLAYLLPSSLTQYDLIIYKY